MRRDGGVAAGGSGTVVVVGLLAGADGGLGPPAILVTVSGALFVLGLWTASGVVRTENRAVVAAATSLVVTATVATLFAIASGASWLGRIGSVGLVFGTYATLVAPVAFGFTSGFTVGRSRYLTAALGLAAAVVCPWLVVQLLGRADAVIGLLGLFLVIVLAVQASGVALAFLLGYRAASVPSD